MSPVCRTFDTAFHIIGGGEEGDKTIVETKEQADHSLHYMTAVALLDDQVLPAQYAPERVTAENVQILLRKITVREEPEYSRRFSDEMPCDITIHMEDGTEYSIEKKDYEGFHTRPMTWKTVVDKFERLSRPYTDTSTREEIITTGEDLEDLSIEELTRPLNDVQLKEHTR